MFISVKYLCTLIGMTDFWISDRVAGYWFSTLHSKFLIILSLFLIYLENKGCSRVLNQKVNYLLLVTVISFSFTNVVWLQILYAYRVYRGSAVFVEVLIQFRNKLRHTSAHQCIQHLIPDDNELPIHVFTSSWVGVVVNFVLELYRRAIFSFKSNFPVLIVRSHIIFQTSIRTRETT